jgi:hypothetical protein
MARGWESKDVEMRQEQAETEWRERQAVRPSAEEQAKARECESLQQTITRVEADLSRATHPRHRQQLESAVTDLKARLVKLQ